MKKFVATWWLLLLVIAFAGLLAYVYWIDPSFTERTKAGELGQLGDVFGGLLNPFVSALTLFVAISVWRLQKGELELTRNEMEQTKLALQEQAKTAEQQRQEQRFFDLLNVYQRTLESISYTRTRIAGNSTNEELLTTSGRRAISEWLSHTSLGTTALQPFNPVLMKTMIKSHWQRSDAPGMLDHYFRVVVRILREARSLLGNEHQRYVELFTIQLSSSELIAIGYYLWLVDDDSDMILMSHEYHLLKHLPQGHLRIELTNLYPYLFSTEPSGASQSVLTP